MKKILSIVAAAVITLGFASCQGGQNEPGKKENVFTIEVSDITATGALVTVTPSDTNIYYYFDILTAEQLKEGYNVDSFAAEMKAGVENEGEKFPAYLSQKTDSWKYSGLLPENEYTVVAFQLDSNYAAVGDWTKKTFSTTKLVIDKTVELKNEGEMTDYTDFMGLFELTLPIDDKAYVQLVFDAESALGHFTENDVDDYFGAWVVYDEENDDYYSVISADITITMNADETAYVVKGEVVGGDGVKYVIDITCPVAGDEEPLSAPAKRSAKKFKLRK
jgi:hypothetical protein